MYVVYEAQDNNSNKRPSVGRRWLSRGGLKTNGDG